MLDGEAPEFTWLEEGTTLGVVLAADGYPTNVLKGPRYRSSRPVPTPMCSMPA